MVEPRYGPKDGDDGANTTGTSTATHAHTSNHDPEGSEDPREMRKRAREAMKAARAQLKAAQAPLPFNPWIMGVAVVGIAFDLLLAGGLILGAGKGNLFDNVTAPTEEAASQAAELGALAIYTRPVPVTDINFVDAKGKAFALSDYKGQVVVLNVWASWCTPCKTEMPELAALQARYPDKAFKVIPVSIDNPDKFAEAQRFIGLNAPLKFYSTSMDVVVKGFGIAGMPATLIIDKQGHEVARVNGAKEWDTPEVNGLMDKLTK
jgi:thiol-disulfide isomerase/thioredoxin